MSRSENGDDPLGFDLLYGDGEQRSPQSTKSSGSGSGSGSASGGGGIQANDLEALAASLQKDANKVLDDGTSSQRTTRTNKKAVVFEDDDEDDATSVATSKRLEEDVGDGWDVVEEKAAAATRSDFLSTWPVDKVSTLAMHVRAAPWHDVRYRLQTFRLGMTGEEIVAWLKSSNFAKSDGEAQDIGAAMVGRRMFYQLNRLSKFRGFAATSKQQYTLEDSHAADQASLSSRISRAVKSANEATAVPYKVVKASGGLVNVIVEERERRPDPSLPYSSEFLRPGDGNPWSMDRQLVPVPPIDDESPDKCEWVLDEWEIVANEQTGENGWKYSLDFKDVSRFVRGDTNNKNFNVRLREWSRPARKRSDRKLEKLQSEASLASVQPDPSSPEFEEERKKDLLLRAAESFNRVARSGIMELNVVQGNDLLVIKDSFVVVEHRHAQFSFRERSDVCPRAKNHHWQYKVDVPIHSDLEGVLISVFQEGSLGRHKCLGTARLDIDVAELARECVLVLKNDDGDEQIDSGDISVNWTFTPSGTGAQKTSAIQRSILTVTLEKAIGLTKEKKTVGPCGVPVPGRKEKKQFFFKVHYFGEYCEMECQSPLVKFIPGDVDVQWTFCALVIPSVPVVIDYWHSDQPTPIGTITLEPCEGEQTFDVEMKRWGIDGMMEQHSSAAGNIGSLRLKTLWVPEEDPLNLAAHGVEANAFDQPRNLVAIWA